LHGAEHDRANLGLAGAGNEAAFLGLVDRYQPSLLRVASLWAEESERAEALVRQTWLRMLHRLERFDGGLSLKGWLCGELISLARTSIGPDPDDFSENAARQDEGPAVDPERFSPVGDRWEGHWSQPPNDWPQLRAAVLPADLQSALQAAVRALPRKQRIMLVLRDSEGLTAREVQSALGASEGDQRLFLHLGRSRVRAALERHHSATKAGATP
jgi:RNA polymerase sigma-70 factor (ECF subfamily)